MDTIIALGARAGRYFIAIPMAIYGVQHFIHRQFVADFIPAWIPGRMFWACFTGAALIAAAVGIVVRKWDRPAATLLGGMIFLWVILLHTSRLAARPHDFAEWRGIFQALAMSGFAFLLAGTLSGSDQSGAGGRSRLFAGLNTLSELGARISPHLIGVSVIALGLQHFAFPEVATPQVPVWVPGNVPANQWSGAALVALGAGVLFRRTARTAAALLGMMIFASMILVHLPVVIAAPRFESDWLKALVMSGGAFLLARSQPGKESLIAADRPVSGVTLTDIPRTNAEGRLGRAGNPLPAADGP